MKRLVILNPRGRNGKAERGFAKLEPGLRKRWGDFEVYRTTCAGDATRRVQSVLEEGAIDQIVAAGGDGTINEVANGYFAGGELPTRDVPLGIVNLGTGGDFFRTVLEESDDYDRALDENRSARVDVGAVHCGGGTHRFLNISSTGLAGDMVSRLKKSRFQAGAAAYFYHTFRTLLAYEPLRVKLEMLTPEGNREKKEIDLVNLFVCNGKYSGGGMKWAPESELRSGHFTLTLISGNRKLPLITHSPKLYSGRVAEFPGAEQWSVREVRVEPEGVLSVEADGEVLQAGGGVRFTIEPAAFPLVL